MKRTITLSVNGESWSLDVEPHETLLEVLRERVGIKSPKVGCERGDCGACTVLLEGRTVRSCLVLAVEVDGCEVVTVEDLSHDGPNDLQRVFIDKNAFQCGFCAPGIVLVATELLAKNASPTEDDVRDALSGNLCRCTGYEPIVDAILEASVATGGGDDA